MGNGVTDSSSCCSSRESESAVLADGWLYRGHPDAACPRWLEAAGEGTSG